METITLTIDGNAISSRADRTILEVARAHGIYIPTLCHHEALRPIGACRLCQVEDEKRGVVVPACVTKIAPGMVITTGSERVRRNRRNIIRLLLAAHPESCVVCERGNKCELRNLAAQMGVGAHGLDKMPYHPGVQDVNPFLVRDLSKCIMCAKCVRADQESVCEGIIDYNFRGFDAHPATLLGRPLERAECTFCGSCLTVCPVGAISEKERCRLDHAGTRTPSVCSFCACGCSIWLEHDHQSVRQVAPTEQPQTANGITLCVRGHFGHDYLNHPDRLTTPLVRTEEGFRPIGWEEALDLIATKLGAIKADHGPDAIGFLGSVRATNEESYLFQKLARQVVGTNNVDATVRAVWAPLMRVIHEATGFAAGSSTFKDVEQSDAVLVIGVDATRSAPVLGYHLKRAARYGGKALIVVDPVRSKLASFAETWLRPVSGVEAQVLKGLIKVVMEEDLIDRQFVTAKTEGYELMAERFARVSVPECAQAAGLEESDLRAAARRFAAAPAGFIVFGEGVAARSDAADLARLLVDLALLTGNLGKERSGLIPVLGDAGGQGALDMGLGPEWLPGQKLTEDAEARASLAKVWGTLLPEKPGLDALEMIQAAHDGILKGLYVFAEHPVGLFPGGDYTAEALRALDFLVVQDLFLTETAKLAHLVLPSTAWAEKNGTVTNIERRVQRIHRAVPPPGDFPPDIEVFKALAGRLGAAWPYKTADDVLSEIEQAAPLYDGIGQMDLNKNAIFWPLPGLENVEDTLPHGIGLPKGRAVFQVPDLAVTAYLPATDEYPTILIVGPVLQHLGAGVRSSHSRRLRKAAPEAALGLPPEDLDALGVVAGQRVRVVSADGALEAPVAAMPELPAGSAFLPGSYPGINPGGLFPWKLTAGGPGRPGSLCRVRIESKTPPEERDIHACS